MATFSEAATALYDLLDGSKGARTLDGQPVLEDGVSQTVPADDAFYGSMSIVDGSGGPIAIGKPKWARYEGFVQLQIRGPRGKGYGKAHRMLNAFAARFEGVTVTVAAGEDVIKLRQLTQDFKGPRDHEYVIVARVPFTRDRLAAAA